MTELKKSLEIRNSEKEKNLISNCFRSDPYLNVYNVLFLLIFLNKICLNQIKTRPSVHQVIHPNGEIGMQYSLPYNLNSVRPVDPHYLDFDYLE